jgi:5-dehydro-2-deoxygluconokinase
MKGGLDVLTVGRVGVDLYAEEPGASFTEARTFQKSVGGSPTNVAVAAARLGLRAAVFTKVGDDGLGEYVRTALAEHFGVDTRFVGIHPSLPTPIVVATMDPPEDPQFLMYRAPQAPDATIVPAEIDLDVVRTVPILWISAGALAVEPSRGTTRLLLEQRRRRRHTVLDLDYRPAM